MRAMPRAARPLELRSPACLRCTTGPSMAGAGYTRGIARMARSYGNLVRAMSGCRARHRWNIVSLSVMALSRDEEDCLARSFPTATDRSAWRV